MTLTTFVIEILHFFLMYLEIMLLTFPKLQGFLGNRILNVKIFMKVKNGKLNCTVSSHRKTSMVGRRSLLTENLTIGLSGG